MKTPQILGRSFKGGFVRQNHKTEWLNATDLVKIGNEYGKQLGLSEKKLNNYLRSNQSVEFFKQIMDEENISKVYEAKKGKNGGTWVHPLVLIDIAMWLNPEFKYHAIKWLNDNLTGSRDDSGESYKMLNSVIAQTAERNPIQLRNIIRQVARGIKKYLHVEDWNKATETQLKARNEIQKSISLLLKAGIDINSAFKTAIANTKYSYLEDTQNFTMKVA